MAHAPVLTASILFNPVPRVTGVFSTVPAGTVTATVLRNNGAQIEQVRGAIKKQAAGGFSFADEEAPFSIALEYRAECFDSAGARIEFTDLAVTSVPYLGTVIHQPLDAARNAIVDPLPAFGASLSSPFNGEVVYPIGRGVGVHIGSGRRGLSSVSLDFATDTITQADAVAGVFGSRARPQLPVVCIRTQPVWRMPMPLFAQILDPRQERFDTQFGGERIYWRMVGTEVAPPVGSLATALLSYGDPEATYATYGAAEAAYATYLAAESDFSIAGAV